MYQRYMRTIVHDSLHSFVYHIMDIIPYYIRSNKAYARMNKHENVHVWPPKHCMTAGSFLHVLTYHTSHAMLQVQHW